MSSGNEARLRMERRYALLATAKGRFDGLEADYQNALLFGIQVANDEAHFILHASKELTQ